LAAFSFSQYESIASLCGFAEYQTPAFQDAAFQARKISGILIPKTEWNTCVFISLEVTKGNFCRLKPLCFVKRSAPA
jgi:hypothetical protein